MIRAASPVTPRNQPRFLVLSPRLVKQIVVAIVFTRSKGRAVRQDNLKQSTRKRGNNNERSH